jgi:serine/threonine-protein kinase
MITGTLPFEPCDSVRDDLLAIVTEPPRPMPEAVHADLRELIAACLSKDPDGRPCSAEALIEELRSAQDAYLASRGMIARRVRPWHT